MSDWTKPNQRDDEVEEAMFMAHDDVERMHWLAEYRLEIARATAKAERERVLAPIEAWMNKHAPNGSPQRMSVFWCELEEMLRAEGGEP